MLDTKVGTNYYDRRKEKGGNSWLRSAETDENEHTASVSFDFMDERKTYQATTYLDAEDAHWQDNPTAYEIEIKEIIRGSILDILMAPDVSTAISLVTK